MFGQIKCAPATLDHVGACVACVERACEIEFASHSCRTVCHRGVVDSQFDAFKNADFSLGKKNTSSDSKQSRSEFSLQLYSGFQTTQIHALERSPKPIASRRVSVSKG